MNNIEFTIVKDLFVKSNENQKINMIKNYLAFNKFYKFDELYIAPKLNAYTLIVTLLCNPSFTYTFKNFKYELKSTEYFDSKDIYFDDDTKIFIDIFKIKYRCLDTEDRVYSTKLVGFVFI